MVKIEDIAITFVPNLTPRAVAHLIERFGCAEGIYSASVENLMHRGELNESIAQQIVSGTGLREAERELNICGRCGVDILTSADGGYPEQLRFISDFPHLLYMVGDGSLLSCPTMCAVMGGQNGVSSYGEKMSLRIIEKIAQVAPETVIVGALEGDLDAVVLRVACDLGLRCVGVTLSPLSTLSQQRYLRLADEILARGGVVVSERGEHSATVDESLAPHHRIIAGLCRGVVVVEAAEIPPIAKYADGYGRTLLAVPGRATDSMSWATNRMISTSMAQMVCSVGDVIEYLELD